MAFGPSKYMPGQIKSQPMAELYRNQNPDEEYMRMMQMMDSQSRQMPPQAVAPAQQAPANPIQAPKDRGMFGRFQGFNPLRFDPDKGVGEGNRLYAIGAMLSGMGSGDPALTANLLEPKLQANRERVAARDEEARRQQMLQQFAGMEGLTPQQQMLIRNGFGVEQLAEQQFATPAAAKFGLDLKEVTDPVTGEKRLVQASEAGGVRAVEGFVPAPPAPDQRPWWAQDGGGVDPAQLANQAAGRSPGVTINGFGGGATSLAQIPVGQPVPEDLLGGITLPPDTYAVRADNPAGFQFATIPGSETDQKAQSGEQAKAGRTYTLGSLIGSYSTLANNKAISARGNSALDNAAAMYSGTAFGQVQDKLGGEVGNLANAEARDTIQGLSMKALMDMISMSDVSAKAMDSDAEMKAWLSAIKSDNYESALTKLHVLDLSFGSGQELERAYADGTIDLNTYQYVTNRVNSDPMVKQMLDKADRYAALGNAVGQSNLTGGERQSIQNLSGLVAPDGSAVTEDDIQETMAATGMTREQIITRLRGK
jgi:hypothetical protein